MFVPPQLYLPIRQQCYYQKTNLSSPPRESQISCRGSDISSISYWELSCRRCRISLAFRRSFYSVRKRTIIFHLIFPRDLRKDVCCTKYVVCVLSIEQNIAVELLQFLLFVLQIPSWILVRVLSALLEEVHYISWSLQANSGVVQ
jgi:hypothetical protein